MTRFEEAGWKGGVSGRPAPGTAGNVAVRQDAIDKDIYDVIYI